MKLRVVFSLFAAILFSLSTQAQERFPQFLKHTVKPGETVKSITEQFNVKSTDFLMLNDLPPSVKLKPGQVVLVRKLKDGERPAVEEADGNITPNEEAAPVKKQPVKEAVKQEPAKQEPAKEEIAEEKPVSQKKHVSIKETETKDADGNDKDVVVEKTKTTTTTEKPKPAKKEPVAEKEETHTAPVKAAPAKTTSAPAASSTASSSGKTVEGPGGVQYTVSDDGYHTVEKGQTFYRIALIYHLTVDQLKDLNGLPNYSVSVGQKLKVKK